MMTAMWLCVCSQALSIASRTYPGLFMLAITAATVAVSRISR